MSWFPMLVRMFRLAFCLYFFFLSWVIHERRWEKSWRNLTLFALLFGFALLELSSWCSFDHSEESISLLDVFPAFRRRNLFFCLALLSNSKLFFKRTFELHGGRCGEIVIASHVFLWERIWERIASTDWVVHGMMIHHGRVVHVWVCRWVVVVAGWVFRGATVVLERITCVWSWCWILVIDVHPDKLL